MSAEEKFLDQLKIAEKNVSFDTDSPGNERSGNQLENDLNPLVISDMDSPGNERKGLGWNELFDPTRPVPMSARLPEVVRKGDHISLFWTLTKPPTPPQEGPEEDRIQFYELDEATVERGWLSFAATRELMKIPDDLVLELVRKLEPEHHPRFLQALKLERLPEPPAVREFPEPFFGYFYYSIYDPESDDLRFSNYREVLIDLQVPGGLDPRPETPINEFLSAPFIDPSKIESPETEVMVTVEAWEFMQTGDELTLVWNGVRSKRDPLKEGDAIGDPVVFRVPADIIESGGSGDNLLVYYEIRDEVRNYSRPSPPAYVTVEDPNALEAPEVEGAENPPYRLDLDALDGADVVIFLPVYDGYVRGDTVTMHWIGLTADADAMPVPYDWPARIINNTRDMLFELPFALAALVVNGSANVFYESQPAAGGAARPSKRRSISIVGKSFELLPPVLQEAVGDIIDLAELTEEVVHVRIPLYSGQREADEVTLFWTGQVGDGEGMTWSTELIVPPGGEETELVFDVSLPFLEPLVTGTLTLSYSVFTPEFDLRRLSSEVVYNVVDSGEVHYPAPTCAQLEGTGDDAFLPSDTAIAVFDIPNTAPLRDGDLVTLHFAAASGTPPAPDIPTQEFKAFPFQFSVANEDILPFEEVDMSVTYSVERGKG
ncbi:hypothetical protein [Pseudomonas sp. KU43P]|uniref:hypothetical protein n=1 Tax=Pseudomonas sp. KU43P TaxID=2487887 RepID=UPI0012AA1929|nr:hypothetical protein [Pseudomonas sp. KU43P]BBH44394.1 hypothetical protein KU43P_08710 [Pseudomonas sp. KU43P]